MTATTAQPNALPPWESGSGFGGRVGVSILSVFGLVIFIILYFTFWAAPYSGVQTAVILLVAMLTFVAINGAAWASWGVRPGRRADRV